MTLKQLQSFILWLRKERIGYTTLTAGGVTIDGVVDGKLERAPAWKAERRQTLYEQYGGELIKQGATAPAAAITDEERVD